MISWKKDFTTVKLARYIYSKSRSISRKYDIPKLFVKTRQHGGKPLSIFTRYYQVCFHL